MEMCKLKIKQLATIARRAHDSPSSVTFAGKGTLATARGEILLISTCHADMATTRPTKTCFQDLPLTYKGRHLFRDALTFALTASSYKTTCVKNAEPLHLTKGTFRAQSSGKGVEDIRGITFNLPHSELVSEEYRIFEAVAGFYKRHKEIEADKKELLQESRDIIRSNPGRLANKWWG